MPILFTKLQTTFVALTAGHTPFDKLVFHYSHHENKTTSSSTKHSKGSSWLLAAGEVTLFSKWLQLEAVADRLDSKNLTLRKLAVNKAITSPANNRREKISNLVVSQTVSNVYCQF